MFQTLTGTEYLQAEIACKHDKTFEKKDWDERLAHFMTLDLLEDDTYKKASNPVGMRAACEAFHATLREEPTGYMISLDASSSGLQLLSLLVSCPASWKLCGGETMKCINAYTTIYKAMNLNGVLTNKQVKDAIMTSLYGSQATPEEVFGANLDVFYETMENMAPGAWDLNISLQELWGMVDGSTYDWVLPDNFHACIETKNKEKQSFSFLGQEHKLIVEVDGRPDFHKGLGPNLIHSIDGFIVREMMRRCSYYPPTVLKIIYAITKGELYMCGKPGKVEMVKILWQHYVTSGFMSARILDYLDSDTLKMVDPLIIGKFIKELPEDPFDTVTVHDCFRVHPNYGNDVRRQYNIIMADINDSTMLTSMCSQVSKRDLKAKKVGKINRDDILNGNYLLT